MGHKGVKSCIEALVSKQSSLDAVKRNPGVTIPITLDFALFHPGISCLKAI
jgi:hypothetical protein